MSVCRVNAQDFDLAREEGQLFQGQRNSRIGGPSLDLGVKLRRSELAAVDIAFQLDQVDAVAGEAA